MDAAPAPEIGPARSATDPTLQHQRRESDRLICRMLGREPGQIADARLPRYFRQKGMALFRRGPSPGPAQFIGAGGPLDQSDLDTGGSDRGDLAGLELLGNFGMVAHESSEPIL